MEENGDLDLPEMDSTFPEPDFFDSSLVSDANPLLPQAQSAAASDESQSLLEPNDSGNQSSGGLRFDDALCEFDEFLIPLPRNPVEGTASPERNRNLSQDESRMEDDEEADEGDDTQEGGEESNLDKTPSVAVPSDPDNDNTPEPAESRARSSATVHLIRLPQPKIESKKITILNKSPSRRRGVTESPPSRVASRSRGQRNNLKRKHSDESDADYDGEGQNKSDNDSDDDDEEEKEEEEEEAEVSTPRTRSSRRKKIAKYDTEDEIKVNSAVKTRSTKRQVKRPTRYEEFDSDSSEHEEKDKEDAASSICSANSISTESLFRAVSPAKRVEKVKKRSNYWEEEGTYYIEENNGRITEIRKCYVKVKKLSKAKIEKWTNPRSDSPPFNNNVVLEVCIDNIQSAKEAVEGGANRIELCSSLVEGGLTPTAGFFSKTKEICQEIPIFVMIRPRGGDFIYSSDEIDIMIDDIEHFKRIGADGFVFGVLTKDGEMDVKKCKRLKDMADPLPCTFHRAFDQVPKPFTTLEQAIGLGFARILTSGQGATAQAGIPLLKSLVHDARGRILIMAGAGVNAKNVAEIVKRTGVHEVHGSASKPVRSLMSLPGPSKSNKRNKGNRKKSVKNVSMGAVDDTVIKVTDATLVAQIVENANSRRAR